MFFDRPPTYVAAGLVKPVRAHFSQHQANRQLELELSILIGREVRNRTIVGKHQVGAQQDIRSSAIAGHGNIPDNGKSKQGFDIRVVRKRLERIPEKYEQIHLSLGDKCADLLIAAKRSAVETMNRQTQFVRQQSPRGAGGVYFTPQHAGQMDLRPFNQLFLLVVVRNECNPFGAHRDSKVESKNTLLQVVKLILFLPPVHVLWRRKTFRVG